MMTTSGLPPLFLILVVLLVLFGLAAADVSSQEEKQGSEQQEQHVQSSSGSLRLGRRRRRRRATAEADPRNTYWDLPQSRTATTSTTTKSTWSDTSTGSFNPYWRLPPQGETGGIEIDDKTIYHAAVAKEKSSKSTLSLLEDGANDIRDEDLMMRMAQNVFVQQCMNLLQGHSYNNRLNRDRYVNFLQEISNESLDAQDFEDLPLFLAMIFFSASCSSGQDCVAQEPVISIRPVGTHENMMNQVLCRQLMRFPFMEVLLPFQFLIRVNSGLSASELLLLSDQEEINEDGEQEDQNESTTNPPTTARLEGALDQVLLRAFNCSDVPREMIRYDGRRRKERRPPRERSRRRQPQPQGDCDFVVQATVEDAADYPCGFKSSCILIFSDVTVYAVLKDTLDEPKLREMTTDVLREAINGNALNDYLRG